MKPFAKRIESVPPYLFAEMDRKKNEAIARGVDIISFGIGDPDQASPSYVIDRLVSEAAKVDNHHYPDYIGLLSFRQAVASYYGKRFGVTLDPKSEVMTLIGSKEGISHLVWAIIDQGDVALIPDPAYPVYSTHTLLAGGVPYLLPLTAENKFLPDLSAIPEEIAKKAKVLFLNYPNNPTGAVATLEFFAEAVAFCKKHDIILVHDNAYAEMTYDSFVAPSVLQVPGAKDVAVEFYSLSKPFNMTGWRIAAMVGNKDVVAALGIIKTNTDSGQWNAVQIAAKVALEQDPAEFFSEMNRVYTGRRNLLVSGLRKLGWPIQSPLGTFYLWAPVPQGMTSATLAGRLLEEAGLIVAAGSAYGQNGEGYIRFAFTLPEARIAEGLERIAKMNLF